jgi:DNA modification methylase
MTQSFLDGRVILHAGDSRDVLATLPDASIDSVVCDPPYALVSIGKRFGKEGAAPAIAGKTGAYARASAGFMGQQWDTGETAFAVEFWAQVWRVLKPGGHVVAFSGTRTYHRMVCAIEDAGFEIRDQIGYLYGCGFPKSHNVKKGAGAAVCRCAPGDDHLRGLRLAEDHAGGVVQAGEAPDLQPTVQRSASRGGVEASRSEGPKGPHGRILCQGGEEGAGECCLEGRRDASQAPGQLCQRALCALPAGSDQHGASGRLCDGAPAGDGAADQAAAAAGGMRAPSGSRPAQQYRDQSGALAGQPQSQDGGAWPHCGRCGKPIVPDGLGTALKPAWEPIVLARKPLDGTVAANVLAHGTGAVNIDGCRVGWSGDAERAAVNAPTAPNSRHAPEPGTGTLGWGGGRVRSVEDVTSPAGRWPANILHDGSDEVVAAFPVTEGGTGAVKRASAEGYRGNALGSESRPAGTPMISHGDSGSAARFFYSAKADAEDRIGSKHPTVKPVDLMQWLCRLVTPPGGTVLDPFAGTGTTGEAAWREGFRAVLIEREVAYREDIARRMDLALASRATRARESAKAKDAGKPVDLGPLFGGSDTVKGGGAADLRPLRRPGRTIGPIGLRR